MRMCTLGTTRQKPYKCVTSCQIGRDRPPPLTLLQSKCMHRSRAFLAGLGAGVTHGEAPKLWRERSDTEVDCPCLGASGAARVSSWGRDGLGLPRMFWGDFLKVVLTPTGAGKNSQNPRTAIVGKGNLEVCNPAWRRSSLDQVPLSPEYLQT